MNCQLTNEFISIVKAIQEAQRTPQDYGTGQLLFHSEVSFLDAVYENKDANTSELSALLGITKGAVTQIAQKLDQKGLIEHYMLNNNKKAKYWRLTELGMVAKKGHEKFHETTNQSLCKYFCSLDESEMKTISGFLSQIKSSIPFCMFTCMNANCNRERSNDE